MAGLTFGIALDFGSRLRPLAAQLERQSALLEAAEAAGFEIVAAGESASAGGFHLPDALLVLATLAQRTRLQLCTGVALLPAWPVWRLALDAAQLDQLSGGRFILGVGLGTAALQAHAGWPAEAIGEKADDVLECLRQLWSGAAGYSAKHVRISGGLPILPRQDRGVPIWVGGAIRRSAVRAARLGDGWYGGVSFPLSQLARQAQTYRDAGGVGSVVVNRVALVASTRAEVDDLAQRYVYTTLGGYAASPEAALADMALVGTPSSVAAQVERYVATGVTHIFARVSLDEMPVEVARGSIELLGREVIPRFARRPNPC